ncbi:MAG: hypothetical protein KDJ41_17475, partial [Hyphomicrobiaceae bacterium]|nr:hypothetical protein [Hyphomicrobiaceae bacterium]
MSGGWFLVALTLALGAYSGGAWQLHRTFDGGRALLPVAAAPTAGGDTTPATDRVRLTAGDTSARPGVDMRRRAEELAQAGTERFSEVLGGGKPDMSASERRRLAQAPAVREGQDRAPARPPLSEAPLGAIQSWFDSSRREYARIMAHLSVGPSTRGRLPPGAVSDWLGRADADFQMIMRGLAVARSGLPGAALPKVARGDGVPRPPQAPSTAVAPDAARRLALKETEDARREAEARARRATEEARRTSEAARKAAEAARREAADREAADRARREAEEKRLAEAARREAEQKRAAERAHREAEEKRLAEAARREAEARRAAEEERRQAEASRRVAERERLSEVQKRAEAARREAAARQAAEKAREEAEARRVAEAARRQAEVKRAA